MSGSIVNVERPSYASYLPPCYLGEADGFLARFVAMLETLMSGRINRPQRLLTSWVRLDSLPLFLDPGATDPDLRYDPESRHLVFLGPMSEARRDELLDRGELLAAFASGDERAIYRKAIKTLAQRSQDRSEEIPGIEQLLDSIERYSDPLTAPASDSSAGTEGIPDQRFFDGDFITYLADWVALSFRQDLPEVQMRRLIAEIVPLYKRRGTVPGIRRLLEIFVDWPVTIGEELGLQVGVRSTINHDAIVGGLAHLFKVGIRYGFREVGEPPRPFNFELLRGIRQRTREVLDLEKPAHTDYQAEYRFPGIIIGEYSSVEVDTLIWPPAEGMEIE